MKMKRLLAAGIMLALASTLDAAPPPPQKQWLDPWRTCGEQVPLWPERLALAKPELKGAETASENVARATMTIYRAKGRNSGAAIMVYPGGGYQGLAVGLEGTEICDWANRIGMT
ncbi:hypothetical protein EAH79_07195 [Sphingomonas koreensis]|nr:hypothetical protein EAH79_07195 [Sphingomonas koreensis]